MSTTTLSAPELSDVQAANSVFWGGRTIWPAIGALQRLLLRDKLAPVLFADLAHQALVQRSSHLVESLKICRQADVRVTETIQAVGLALRADRLERIDAAAAGSSGPSIPAGVETITRVVEEAAGRPGPG